MEDTKIESEYIFLDSKNIKLKSVGEIINEDSIMEVNGKLLLGINDYKIIILLRRKFSLEISGATRPKFPWAVRICEAKRTCGEATFLMQAKYRIIIFFMIY